MYKNSLKALLITCGLIATSAQGESLFERLAEELARGETTSLLFYSQAERDVAFRRVADLYPTRTIRAGNNVLPMPNALRDFSGLNYMVDGKSYALEQFLTQPYMKGLLVWQDGHVLFERYGDGHDRDTQWVSFSVAKSVTSMLIGAAIKDGYINSVNDPVTHYVARFRGTDYADATVRDVLQMASGVAWNEDYADPDSDVSRAGGANGIALQNYLANMQRVAKPGEKFNYNSAETNLVGEILRAAIGNNASTYATHKIWQPFGMESDATWLLGAPGGGELGGCCINATLRDYVRIGIFALRGGRLHDGTTVLPENWMAESTRPSRGYDGYGYLWWLDEGAMYRARGIFAQQIVIDPAEKFVIAVHSNAPTAVASEYHAHLEGVIEALAARLAED